MAPTAHEDGRLMSLTVAVALGGAAVASCVVWWRCQGARDESQHVEQRPDEDTKSTLAWQDGAPDAHGHVRFKQRRQPAACMESRSTDFLQLVSQRRSLRFFSPDPLPDAVLQRCVQAAGTAPSGAHCQPWHFCMVKSAHVKEKLRALVEEAEQVNYDRRMRKSWVDDVAPLVANLHGSNGEVLKPYLTDAPVLCVVMKQVHGVAPDGSRKDNYYVEQSVGLAVGLFLAALTNVGLFTLTSTPMGAERQIRELLGRPDNEKVYLLMPIGFAADSATVPHRSAAELRKPVAEICTWH